MTRETNLHPHRITIRQALADLGWLPALFSALVGGPSILALLQMIFVEHRLVDALQWIVDGYSQIAAVLGAAIEPALRSMLEWLSSVLPWRLELYPHWRPFFLLLMTVVMAFVRAEWRNAPLTSLLMGLVNAAGAMLGACLVGIFPLSSAWWMQGLSAALPMEAFFVFVGLVMAATAVGGPRSSPDPIREFVETLLVGTIFAAIAFAVAAGLSFVPAIASGAGLATLALFILAGGLFPLADALRDGFMPDARLSLSIISGFAVAGMIVAADAVIKLLIA